MPDDVNQSKKRPPEDFINLDNIGASAALYVAIRESLKIRIAQLLLIICAIAGIATAYSATEESLTQSYAIEIASGAAFFLIAMVALDHDLPSIPKAGDELQVTDRHIQIMAPFILFDVAIFAGALSFFSSGVTQSLLIEASVGCLVLALLDVALQTWLQSWARRSEDALRKFNDWLRTVGTE